MERQRVDGDSYIFEATTWKPAADVLPVATVPPDLRAGYEKVLAELERLQAQVDEIRAMLDAMNGGK